MTAMTGGGGHGCGGRAVRWPGCAQGHGGGCGPAARGGRWQVDRGPDVRHVHR